MSDYLVASLEPLGFSADASVTPRLRPSAEGMRTAKVWLSERGLLDRRLITIHPGSGSPRKNWPLDRFAEVAAQLTAEGHELVVTLGPTEEESGPEWLQAWRSTQAHVARGLDVDTLAAILSTCSAYVGNDSGVSHLAASVGVPTVALFGPTDPIQWAPRGECVSVLLRSRLEPPGSSDGYASNS